MKKVLILCFLLTGCVHLLYQENGINYYEATCSSRFDTIGKCYKKAHKKCQGEFQVISEDKRWGSIIFTCKPQYYGY